MTIANNFPIRPSYPHVALAKDAACKLHTGHCVVLWPSVIQFVLRARGRSVKVVAIFEDIMSVVDPRCRRDNWRERVIELLHKRPEFRQLADGCWGLCEWPRPVE